MALCDEFPPFSFKNIILLMMYYFCALTNHEWFYSRLQSFMVLSSDMAFTDNLYSVP